MIQANELRKGNYVLLKCKDEKDERAKLLTIDELNGCYYNRATNKSLVNKPYNNRNSWCDFDIIEPIQLTEEILLKCGFDKSNDLDKFYHLDLLNEWTRIYFNPKHNICQLSINQHDSCIRIKYLHELQNLVFALTQKELQIEL